MPSKAKATASGASAGNRLASLKIALWLSMVLLTVVFIRLRLLDFPLERDEGEYAYMGQLMLHGVPPYTQAYNMKWPGTYATYAGLMAVFGQTTAAIHFGLLLVNLANSWLVFRLARNICGNPGAVIAAGTFSFLAMSPSTLGQAAHATHFVILPVLAGILLLRDIDEKTCRLRIFAAGILIGVGLLMKQTGALFGLFAALWVAWVEITRLGRDWKRLTTRWGVLFLGGLLPLIITCMILLAAGAFGRFWHWTVDYALNYASILSPKDGAGRLLFSGFSLLKVAVGLWGISVLGFGLLWVEPALRRWRVFIAGFTIFSFLAVCPGFYFRPHYFILFLPAAGLLAGVTARALMDWFDRPGFTRFRIVAPALLFTVAAAQSLWTSRAFFFQLTPIQACRSVYGLDAFPESVEIAKFIDKKCPLDATIAVMGSEPQIYFYTSRRAATGYIYTYPLMEPQPMAASMQEEMIREIEQSKPRYIIFVSVFMSWDERPNSSRLIFDWFDEYQKNFRMVALAEINSVTETKYTWDCAPGSPLPSRKNNWVAVLEAKARAAPAPR